MGSLCALVFLLAACDGGAPPPDLSGTWTTEDPAYADRYLRIDEKILEIGVSKDHYTMHPIQSLRAEPGTSGQQIYHLEYLGPVGERITMALELIETDSGLAMRLSHREHLWRRQSS